MNMRFRSCEKEKKNVGFVIAVGRDTQQLKGNDHNNSYRAYRFTYLSAFYLYSYSDRCNVAHFSIVILEKKKKKMLTTNKIVFFVFFFSERLTVTECLQHPWFSAHESPETPLALETTSSATDKEAERPSNPTKSIGAGEKTQDTKTATNSSKTSSSNVSSAESKPVASRAVSSHTDNVYTTKSKTLSMPARIGLSPDRRDTFKKNMDSLAQRFSTSTEIVIIEPTSASQRRATATHTMPAGEIFKCTPVFILGEEQQCDSGISDTVSEISTDSSSDRSSIYSDDSLDFILYGKTQSRASFPFVGTDTDRWEQKHPRIWPRECSGVVSKALSRFSSEPVTGKAVRTAPPTTRGRASLEAMRERGGELVVIREPVRAGRYTRYSEVQCESVQARIRRFQVHGAS